MSSAPTAPDPTPRLWPRVLVLVLIAIAFGGLALGPQWLGQGDARAEIAYSRFNELVEEGKVDHVSLEGHEIEGSLAKEQKLGPDDVKTDTFRTRVPDFGDPKVLSRLESKGVNVDVAPADQESSWYWLIWLLPWVLIMGAFFFAQRRMAQRMGAGGGPGGLAGLSQTKAKRVEAQESRTRFDDVAGQDAAKKDVVELVEFLRTPDKYRKLGADVPHGVLLSGAPGTGKTLMARALAGEADVPFFHMSGSEFIEMVVGVGAARVRQTFAEAKKHQPSILFIDEIDAIGRQRGTGMGGGHDEREQTLNQILDEMDGFTGQEAVIVVAATNRPDVLDPALLRPGRFDRRLTLEQPDRDARHRILELKTKNVPLEDDVDLAEIAKATPGFSGAHLDNLVNEAAMLAARRDASKVAADDFDEARDKVMMGPARSVTIDDDERRRLAVHEAGHTSAAHYLEHADTPMKVTVVPRGQALGGTHQVPERESYTMAEDELHDRLVALLAGRASERLFLGTVSSGADDDIQKATQLARAMVGRWGMDEDVGPVDVRVSEENPFLGYEMTHRRPFSDQTAAAVDAGVKKLLVNAQKRAAELLETHRDRIDALAQELAREETVTKDRIAELLGDRERSSEQSAAAE